MSPNCRDIIGQGKRRGEGHSPIYTSNKHELVRLHDPVATTSNHLLSSRDLGVASSPKAGQHR